MTRSRVIIYNLATRKQPAALQSTLPLNRLKGMPDRIHETIMATDRAVNISLASDAPYPLDAMKREREWVPYPCEAEEDLRHDEVGE
ncbi:MAG: hypothetical protein WCF90_04375 [Methanomicrobiales archaeon]